MSGDRSRRDPDGARRLAAAFARLDDAARASLLDFAEFLVARAAAPATARVVSLRPPRETVLQAVRRLNLSYPMLDRGRLTRPVGDLLSQHLVDGRDPVEVIDELEALYAGALREFGGGR